MGRPAKTLVVSAEDRAQLESIARSQSLPAALARRAQMILRMDNGETVSAVARRYRYSRPTVTLWRTRFGVRVRFVQKVALSLSRSIRHHGAGGRT